MEKRYGSGFVEQMCPACRGEGSMKGRGHHGAMRNCEDCGGTGKRIIKPKADVGGEGQDAREGR